VARSPTAKEMSKIMDAREFWELRFSVEVSARYHDWRRATMLTIIRMIRGITFFSAIITLATAFNPVHMSSSAGAYLVAMLATLIACVNLLDLIADFSGAAERHEVLYKRFQSLLAEISRHEPEWEKYVSEWRAEAQSIRVDEPPTLWVIYARSWNQTIERHGAERKGYYRRITWVQGLFGWLIHFSPQDFPAIDAS
jgi:hypothetical protein